MAPKFKASPAHIPENDQGRGVGGFLLNPAMA